MFDKMKQMMEMKRQADAIKRELDAMIVDVEEIRGINIRISGSQNFQSLQIDSGLIAEANKAKLESDLLRSMNAAIKKSQTMAAQKMASLMPGLS